MKTVTIITYILEGQPKNMTHAKIDLEKVNNKKKFLALKVFFETVANFKWDDIMQMQSNNKKITNL